MRAISECAIRYIERLPDPTLKAEIRPEEMALRIVLGCTRNFNANSLIE